MIALWLVFLSVFWFFTYQSSRFNLTGWALMSVGIALVYQSFTRRRILGLVALLVIFPPVFYNYSNGVRWLLFDAGRFGVRVENGEYVGVSQVHWPSFTLGWLDRRQYLNLHLNYHPLAEYCGAKLEDSDLVLLVGEHRMMHWNCRVMGSDWFDSPALLPYLRHNDSADQVLDALRSDGVTHIAFNLREWGAGWEYNRRHFREDELNRMREMMASPRLRHVFASDPDWIYLVQILPQ
jgi:hypothetical protein